MVRWKIAAVAVFITLTVYGGSVFAQAGQPSSQGETPADRDPRMEQMIDMMFRNMDTNHDGKISMSEWMAFQEKQFMLMDKNGDGFLTREEIRADMMNRMRANRQQERARPPQQ